MVKEQETLNLAIQCHQEGNFEAAEKLYREILEYNPTNDSVLYCLGVMANQLGHYAAAISYLSKAVELNPTFDYYKDLGNIYFDLSRTEEAIYCYKKVLELKLDDIDTHYNLGLIYQQTNNFDDAIKCFENVLRLNDKDVAVYNMLGGLYFNFKKEFLTAIKCFEKAIEIKPDYADAYFNRGLVFNYVDKIDEAIKNYEKALELNLNSDALYINLGTAFQDKKDIEKAIYFYKKGLELYPDNSVLRFNLGCCLVKNGDFKDGWEYLESRMDIFEHHKLKFDPNLKPKWDGNQPIQDKIIYIYPASMSFGNGDSMNFARYMPILEAMGAKVLCKVQPGLVRLFKQSNLKAEIIDNSTPDESLEFDYQMPFMSLPGAFEANPDNIPFKNSYLKADPEKVNYYKEKYFDNNSFKVGIFWFSEVSSTDRIMSLSDFYPLIQLENIKVYSLQKGSGIEQLNSLPEGMEVVNLGETFNDFSDTAAAIENLDLVITPDTSIIHLAGALGKPGWVMLPFLCDWRWLTDTEDSIWYESVRLFRQNEPRNWHGVMEKVVNALKVKLSE
ncbi:MAG: hypothetical protein A2287_07255 [Candidatus Melainabacteria bacterium RIFOXYA12_FULL_32_12]|nr:MAG: hypothetical protein A2255_06240 [Candidatus Melainabacteria bacterium RIFOXYA2_FULL_32_9]OGI30547.1 MAG: hypothetical protein A2287_07255 [Candidatus Melainabacteria bacterium RIFOXYA12_FULL_32_12]